MTKVLIIIPALFLSACANNQIINQTQLLITDLPKLRGACGLPSLVSQGEIKKEEPLEAKSSVNDCQGPQYVGY